MTLFCPPAYDPAYIRSEWISWQAARRLVAMWDGPDL
jgi:hypothetical protein